MPLQGGYLDISKGEIEWNVAPNLTRPLGNGSMQICDEKVCNITTSTSSLPNMDAMTSVHLYM